MNKDKRTNIKENKSPSQINGINKRINNSKYSKYNNASKPKISQRKNKSELKLQTTHQKFLPILAIDTHSNKSNLKNDNFMSANKVKSNTLSMGFYSTKTSEELQKTLSFNKNRMLKNKTELNELKIQYNKLSEDNKNNKKILSKILNLKIIDNIQKKN